MNTKLHAICDSQGRPLDLFVTAGQVSDYIGARALLSSLPKVDWLLGDRGYDADWFREALKDKGISACIAGRKQRKTPVKYDKRRYKRRNRIEIMFGRLKDWRRVATRYDRLPKVFLSAIALAANRSTICRTLREGFAKGYQSGRSRKFHREHGGSSWVLRPFRARTAMITRSKNVHSLSDIRSRGKLVSIADTSLNNT